MIFQIFQPRLDNLDMCEHTSDFSFLTRARPSTVIVGLHKVPRGLQQHWFAGSAARASPPVRLHLCVDHDERGRVAAHLRARERHLRHPGSPGDDAQIRQRRALHQI